MVKDEGSVFQKKELDVEVVVVKGKKRNLYFEKKFAGGEEFLYEINRFLTAKFHHMNCLLGVKPFANMEKFIKGEG
jgi:hypothetical protein